MSSEAQSDLVREAFAVGAADFLVKPIRRNEVVTLWQHVWRSMQVLAGAGKLLQPLPCRNERLVIIGMAHWGCCLTQLHHVAGGGKAASGCNSKRDSVWRGATGPPFGAPAVAVKIEVQETQCFKRLQSPSAA